MKGKYLWLFASAIALIACHGDGNNNNISSSTSLSSTAATTSVFVSEDNLGGEYNKVWVKVYSVNAINANGQEHLLYSNIDGAVFNLSELHKVSALLDTRQLPAGAYRTLRITLANQVKLIDANGQTIIAQFNTNGTPKVIDVPAAFSVSTNLNTDIGLNVTFNEFQYKTVGTWDTPIIVFDGEESVLSREQRYAQAECWVTVIVDSALLLNVNERFDRYGTHDPAAQANRYLRISHPTRGRLNQIEYAKLRDLTRTHDQSSLTLQLLKTRHEVIPYDDSIILQVLRCERFEPSAKTVTTGFNANQLEHHNHVQSNANFLFETEVNSNNGIFRPGKTGKQSIKI